MISDQEMMKLASIISENGGALLGLTIKIPKYTLIFMLNNLIFVSANELSSDVLKQFHSEFFKGLKKLDYLSLDYQ